MKTALHNTTWLQRIAFYLLALAVLAVAGWSAGAVMLAALGGGLALIGSWIAGLGWKSAPLEEAEWTDRRYADKRCAKSKHFFRRWDRRASR